MCGVFGFSKLTPKTRVMAHYLAYAMEGRGDDSWGGSDGVDLIKRTGPVSASFYVPKDWTQAIFHTRAATVGEVSERNAHPFSVPREGRAPVIGLHNGGVWNWKELNEKYHRDCQVDSEHIFYQLAHGLPLNELFGRGTVVYFDEFDGERLINLIRWKHGDLEVAITDEDGVIFCSNKDPIDRAARFARVTGVKFLAPFVDQQKYVLTPEEAIDTQQKMEFDKPFLTQLPDRSAKSKQSGQSTTAGNGWEKNFSLCVMCSKVHTEHVVCAGCQKTTRGLFEEMRRSRGTHTDSGLLPALVTVVTKMGLV